MIALDLWFPAGDSRREEPGSAATHGQFGITLGSASRIAGRDTFHYISIPKMDQLIWTSDDLLSGLDCSKKWDLLGYTTNASQSHPVARN